MQNFNVPNALKLIDSSTGQTVTISTALIAILFYAGFNFSYYRKAGMGFLRSTPGILMIVGCVFLLVGDGFEKLRSMAHHVYFEESFELCGYAVILLAACVANSSSGEVANASPDPKMGRES